MTCSKCGGQISNGSYCMRCGTNNEVRQPQPVDMEKGRIADLIKEPAPVDPNQKANEFALLVAAKEEERVETGALTFLLAIIINYTFVVTLQVMGYLTLFSLTSSNTLKVIWPLLPLGIILVILIKRHIISVYQSQGDIAINHISRNLIRKSILVWFIYFTCSIFLPLAALALKMGTPIGEILETTWEFIKLFVENMWPYILSFFGYIGLVLVGLNIQKK